MSGEVYTPLGTRVLMLTDGGSIVVTKDDSELVELRVNHRGARTMTVRLSQSDCLALIEFLAVAARPHSGKPLIDALPDGEQP